VRGPCTNNPLCIAGKQNEPLLSNLRRGLIDPDTPKEVMTRTSYDGTKQVLVFSDEFNTDGRAFYDGDDPYFQAVDIWYGATMDLEVSQARLSLARTVLTCSTVVRSRSSRHRRRNAQPSFHCQQKSWS
jgi:beta-glucanase (GH16 family)